MERALILNTDRRLTAQLQALLRHMDPSFKAVLVGTDSRAASLRAVRQIRSAMPDVPVIAVGRTADCALLERLSRLGVTAFLSASFPFEEARSWLQDNFERYNTGMATLVGIAGTTTGPALDSDQLRLKEQLLFENLRSLGRVIVAYSGGTDSAYLAWAANRVLGPQAVAVTADSASIPETHKRDAEEFARENGISHEYIDTYEFENPEYVANNADRCFHCKDELFQRLQEVAAERGITHTVYGVNKDDLGDHRPGQNAARLHEVKSPLVEAELTKAEIRELSRLAGLRTWDRPASACLSSRIPYGTPVTPDTVRTIDQGEEALKTLGFRQFRVRFHGELVRIEVAKEELARALNVEMAAAMTDIFKALGFHYVTLDLEGYRQGAMNEVLNLRK